MTISMNLWSVENGALHAIQRSRVDLESQLEDWVCADPMLLNLDVMIIGRQVSTAINFDPLSAIKIDPPGCSVCVLTDNFLLPA